MAYCTEFKTYFVCSCSMAYEAWEDNKFFLRFTARPECSEKKGAMQKRVLRYADTTPPVTCKWWEFWKRPLMRTGYWESRNAEIVSFEMNALFKVRELLAKGKEDKAPELANQILKGAEAHRLTIEGRKNPLNLWEK